MFGWFKKKSKSKAGERLVSAAKSAREIARGEKPAANMAERIKQLEGEGYVNHGEITGSDGRKMTIMAKEPERK